MSKPITWRNVGSNVDAPDLSNVSDLMGRAQQGVNSAFAGANKLIDKRQTIEDDNRENLVGNQTDQFEKSLRDRFQNPEDLQAARESGELQAMRDQFGQYGLDTERTGASAIDSMVSGMQQRQNQQYQYDETQRKQADQPVIAELQSMRNGITSEGGIGAINENIAGYRDEVARRVEAGELSQQAGASLMSDVSEYQNVLEADFRGDRTAGRKEQEYQRLQSAEQAIKDATTAQSQSYEAYDNQVNQYLSDAGNVLGLSAGQATNPDAVQAALQNASPEARKQYEQLRSEGLSIQNPRQNDANTVQANYEKFKEYMPDGEAWAQAQAIDQQMLEMEGLSARAQGQLATAKQNRNDALARNDFWKAEQAQESPAEILLSVTEKAKGMKDGRWANWIENNKTEVDDFIAKAVGGEFEVGGTKTPLPRSVIETALLRSEPGWITDDNPGDELEAILGQLGLGDQLEQYNTETKGYKNYEARLRANGLGRQSGGNAQRVLGAMPSTRSLSAPPTEGRIPELPFRTDNAANAPQSRPTIDAPPMVINQLDALQQRLEERKGDKSIKAKAEKRQAMQELVRLLPDEALKNGSEYLPKSSTAVATEIKRRKEIKEQKALDKAVAEPVFGSVF